MAISVLDLFKVGIGPSSSHTVGPMKAARMFCAQIAAENRLTEVARVKVTLYGSLGATGRGHGSDKAIMLGLIGCQPDTVDPDEIPGLLDDIRRGGRLALNADRSIEFDAATDIVFNRRESLPAHANGMRLEALGCDGVVVRAGTYYSVGGGFVVTEEIAGDGSRHSAIAPDPATLPLPFHSCADLLALTEQHRCSIADVMRRNERYWRSDEETTERLMAIWRAMQACVERGCRTDGTLPGGFKVKRRAASLFKSLSGKEAIRDDPLLVMDWVNLFALAVNEENAAGGRVVTAPTNGAAGIIPAVLHYWLGYVPGSEESRVIDFLLTAGAIGILFKNNASISGAEVGCQGEVGVACSMAAAGLCAIQGGTPAQVENAAEIGMEHHLGLTCDPVGGLVQIPCIERNAIAAVKAINAARMALYGDGTHHVSLDNVIKTMRETGADMMTKYKETSRGGLAVNVVEC
jgi:L-serine dehydratase